MKLQRKYCVQADSLAGISLLIRSLIAQLAISPNVLVERDCIRMLCDLYKYVDDRPHKTLMTMYTEIAWSFNTCVKLIPGSLKAMLGDNPKTFVVGLIKLLECREYGKF